MADRCRKIAISLRTAHERNRLSATDLNPRRDRAFGMRGVVGQLEGVDLGKMNLQLVTNEENQDRAQCGKNEASGMKSFVGRARKHVGYGTAKD